ncbi:hypothetical protein O181_065168 [Austropuccinia psidii MF-1]|uniref:Uncharacterized protein n=1 Tax=Austropuccinia psidii MF-1 TaxID=1389203 RepID=A0A9Q3EP82_9BASI|nr:hypothetical protein [Austropuccinia psidii MF-1]
MSQPRAITPPMGVCGNHSLTSFYVQLAISSFLWPIGPYWCFMAFGTHLLSLANHGLRPYPALIGLFGRSSTSPTARPIPSFWALGVHMDFQGPLAPLATTRAFGKTHLIMGFLGHLDPLRPLWCAGCGLRPMVHGTLRPLLAQIRGV